MDKRAPKKKQAKRAPKRAKPAAAAPKLELLWIAAGELDDHPQNWRRHPESQAAAFRGLLQAVGWAGYVLYNLNTKRSLDGHMRKGSVPPATIVPVLAGRWTEAQERLILATYNPIGAAAGVDAEAGERLMHELESELPEVQALLDGLAEDFGVEDVGEKPTPRRTRDPDDEGGGGGGAADDDDGLTHTVMVRCKDELDQRTLVAHLKTMGFTAKAALEMDA